MFPRRQENIQSAFGCKARAMRQICAAINHQQTPQSSKCPIGTGFGRQSFKSTALATRVPSQASAGKVSSHANPISLAELNA
jgi:hypothetical protein